MSLTPFISTSWADPWAIKPVGKRPEELHWEPRVKQPHSKRTRYQYDADTKICDWCKKEFSRFKRGRAISGKRWQATRFCSRVCMSKSCGRANLPSKEQRAARAAQKKGVIDSGSERG